MDELWRDLNNEWAIFNHTRVLKGKGVLRKAVGHIPLFALIPQVKQRDNCLIRKKDIFVEDVFIKEILGI